MSGNTFSWVFKRSKKNNKLRISEGVFLPSSKTRKLAVVVKKKDEKSAVKRNKTRRKLYAVLQQAKKELLLAQKPCRGGIWIFKKNNKSKTLAFAQRVAAAKNFLTESQ